MELTAEQRRVVDHIGGPLRVVGGYGTGRTTALAARYLDLVRRHRASTVLVVCGSRGAASRFRDSVLPHLSGGFDALPVTTWFGVAFDLVNRAGGRVQLLSASEQRAVVRRLLRTESSGDWPVSGRFLGRDAFAEEVAGALLEYQAHGAPDPDTLAGGWQELGRFAERYLGFLGDREQVDTAGLMVAAARVAARGAYAHVLVDDHDGPDLAQHRLLGALAGPGDDVAVASRSAEPLPWPAVDVALTEPFRRPAEPELVACSHPSTEPEAVAAELLGARGEGTAWSEMAVLVRRLHPDGRRLVRALRRHGIPVTSTSRMSPRGNDPAVTAILDLLRWVTRPDDDDGVLDRLLASPLAVLGPDGLVALRDELVTLSATATPADLAFLVWQRGLAHLATGGRRDDEALDAVVAFLDGLERQADAHRGPRLPDLLATLDDEGLEPDSWRVSNAPVELDTVTVSSIAAAAGREWHSVVLTGCVEGALPRIRGRAPLFDPASLDGTDGTTSPAEQRQRSLAEERRLFALAHSRATGRLIATAAPRPGVLLSRFVEGWTTRSARPLAIAGPAPVRLEPTRGTVEVFPDGRLVLSASQLETYDDCPLRYAYQYGLRVNDEAGAPAALGSLVHQVLAEFLRPDRPADAPPRSREELLALAAERWTDDIARYRPQIEECRRDYFQMLEDWWAREGEGPSAPEVLEVERRFDVELGNLRLVGAIDRVDRADDGEGIRIVDYKTGRSEPRADAMADDLQLAVYHLAASRDGELSALGPVHELRLLYLRTMHVYEQPVVAGHAATTEARVAEVAAAIRAERFEPAVDASCRNCSFHRLCPLQLEGREVGAP